MAEITTKNTKTDIIKAYNELLMKVKEQKAPDRQAERKKEEEKKVVNTASQTTIEKIIKSLADVKLEIVKSLDTLGEELIEEYKRLTNLKQAIEIETKTLEEIHEIKVNADSLAALLLALKEKQEKFDEEINQKKTEFDADMTQKRQQWKKEQEEAELLRKEKETQVKKERQREEEEYNYSLQLKRKKDKDEYEAKKAAMEKELRDKRAALQIELSEREAAISSREKEYEELKAKVESFPPQLDNAIKETEKTVIERIETKYKHDVDLKAKEVEGERKLSKQIISSMESKIKEQDEMIRQLTQRANEAGLQVKDIAVKAIEGASSQRMISRDSEKHAEPTVQKV